jgi:hypothetical protein
MLHIDADQDLGEFEKVGKLRFNCIVISSQLLALPLLLMTPGWCCINCNHTQPHFVLFETNHHMSCCNSWSKA